VIPSEEEFPYTIRVVSEVLMSMVPHLREAFAEALWHLWMQVCLSKSLLREFLPVWLLTKIIPTGFVTFMDIQGIEDFFGDMDFKVAGTKDGITAIQVDIKIDGLTEEIIKQAFELTRKGRLYIIDNVLLKAIPEPRKQMSKYAPKIISTTINPDKIREVIGPGGKMINKIIDETGVKIDINDDGRVYIFSSDIQAGKKSSQYDRGNSKRY